MVVIGHVLALTLKFFLPLQRVSKQEIAVEASWDLDGNRLAAPHLVSAPLRTANGIDNK